MVRPKRVKARVLKQPDWYRVPKKFRRAVPIQKKKPAKKRFDWWMLVFIVLAVTGFSIMIFSLIHT